jgi:arylsulfatase A-like enzyme
VGVIALACVPLSLRADPRPNVVLIIADDMAWDDCGAYGNAAIRTPHIDGLRRQGMRFDRAFLTISSCSPSRASLITGRYPHRTDAEELHWPLPADQVTFVELLREAGYWTAAAGKWHLGDHVRERFELLREADTSGFQLPSGSAAAGGRFQEQAVGDARSGCTDWLSVLRARPDDRPFFLWLAALDPHRPYDPALAERMYRPDQARVAPYHPDVPEVRRDYLAYYAEITRLDRFVGKVFGELERQQVADTTLVIFLSDNGRPFPRDKTTLYDSGIKTPLIARFPPMIAADSACSSLVSSIDVAPTILELAGVSPPQSMDGRSFASLLRDPARTIRSYVYAEKNWHDFEDHARAVRDTRFKYIRNHYADLPLTPPADVLRSPTFAALQQRHTAGPLPPPQQVCFRQPRPAEELYDTWHDPHELTNLAASPQWADELTRMRGALAAWERQTGDDAPGLRTADEFDRQTGLPTAARRRPRASKREMVASGLTAE